MTRSIDTRWASCNDFKCNYTISINQYIIEVISAWASDMRFTMFVTHYLIISLQLFRDESYLLQVFTYFSLVHLLHLRYDSLGMPHILNLDLLNSKVHKFLDLLCLFIMIEVFLCLSLQF